MFHLVSKRNVFLLELSVIHWNLPGRSGNPLKQRKNIKEMGHVYQISLLFSSENQSGERMWWCHYDIIDFGIRNSELLSNQKLSNTEVRDPVEDVIIWPTYCKISICQSQFQDFIRDATTSEQLCFKCRILEIKCSPWTSSINIHAYSLPHNSSYPCSLSVIFFLTFPSI